MKQSEIITNFNKLFEERYREAWHKAIQSDEIVYMSVLQIEKNVFSLEFGQLRESLMTLFFDPELIFENVSMNDLIKHLSESDSKKCIDMQSRFFDNDDYIFYDIREMILMWIKKNCQYAIDKYKDELIYKRLELFKKSKTYYTLINLLESILNDNEKDEKPEIEDYVQRLYVERKELVDRITKLEAFIKTDKFKSLSNAEKSMMKKQLSAMKEYDEQLQLRLNLKTKGGDSYEK